MIEVRLREVVDSDLDLFYEFGCDEEANRMAAFTSPEPHDRTRFAAHWARIRAEPTVVNRAILVDGAVVGSIAKYELDGEPEITYWIGRAYWGRGIASAALRAFLPLLAQRPLFARAALENIGSLRVLAKCGFARVGEDVGFANARGAEIAEAILRLD